MKAERNSQLGLVPHARHIVLEKVRLIPQRLSVASTPSSETAFGAIWGVGGTLLALLIVKRIREVHPQAAIVSKDPPNLVEDLEQMPDEVIGMWFVSQFALPTVRPENRSTVPALQIERRGGECNLDQFGRKCPEARYCICRQNLKRIIHCQLVRRDQ
jgi:hypothetical protein